MKRILLFKLLCLPLLQACGGGGVETTTNVAPDKVVPTSTVSTPVDSSQPESLFGEDQQTITSLNLEYFGDAKINVLIPNDFVGQSLLQIHRIENDQKILVMKGLVDPGTEHTIDISSSDNATLITASLTYTGDYRFGETVEITSEVMGYEGH